MCNLYSLTTNQDAIRRQFRVERDLAGNLPPLPAIFPDQRRALNSIVGPMSGHEGSLGDMTLLRPSSAPLARGNVPRRSYAR